MKVGEPAATPVTIPALVTVAIVTSLLIHVPPLTGDNVIVEPAQTADVAVTVGFAFTVTAVEVAEQVVVLSVKVNVGEPAATPVTTPAFVTVANITLLLDQVPPLTGDRVIVEPTQTANGAVTVGFPFTVIALVVAEQVVALSLKVNVGEPDLTPVTIPALVTVAKVILLLVHVPPLTGDRVTVEPEQTDNGEVTVGCAITVTAVVVAEQVVVL